MGKTKLSLEDIEQIKKSKGALSASEVQRKYNIGWARLQKIWDTAKQDTAKDAKIESVTKESSVQQPQEDINREVERIVPQVSHREIVVEDFYARLGQLETKMDIQTAQIERQTILMQNILDSLDAVSDLESDTQSILEKENKESYTLQDIGKSMQEYMDFSKTLVYCIITGFAVWQVLCKTWKHVDKSTEVNTNVKPTNVKPPSKPTRPSFFKKEPDPFDF